MPLQNRVRPDGEIIAVGARGTMMGNRGGRLHDDMRRLGKRRWASKAWICCRLSFNGRQRQVMGPSYTELFFLDEATALAAGHRPCFECRRADAIRFAALWRAVRGEPGRAPAAAIDAVLHAERLTAEGGKRTYCARASELPDGAIFRHDGGTFLVRGGAHWTWTYAGYRPARALARSQVDVLTPAAIVAIMAAGYRPQVHPSVGS